MRVQSLGWKDALEKGMATHSRILGEFHGQRSLARYSPSIGFQGQTWLKWGPVGSSFKVSGSPPPLQSTLLGCKLSLLQHGFPGQDTRREYY